MNVSTVMMEMAPPSSEYKRKPSDPLNAAQKEPHDYKECRQAQHKTPMG